MSSLFTKCIMNLSCNIVGCEGRHGTNWTSWTTRCSVHRGRTYCSTRVSRIPRREGHQGNYTNHFQIITDITFVLYFPSAFWLKTVIIIFSLMYGLCYNYYKCISLLATNGRQVINNRQKCLSLTLYPRPYPVHCSITVIHFLFGLSVFSCV